MGGEARTEEQLLADWQVFVRLLVRTAPDHPPQPYLVEAVRRTEGRSWRRVHLRRLAEERHPPTAPSHSDDPDALRKLPARYAICAPPTNGGS